MRLSQDHTNKEAPIENQSNQTPFHESLHNQQKEESMPDTQVSAAGKQDGDHKNSHSSEDKTDDSSNSTMVNKRQRGSEPKVYGASKEETESKLKEDNDIEFE